MALTFENFFWCPGNLGEGTDEFAKFNIRFNNLVELLQESPTQPPICEWKNSDAREHMAKVCLSVKRDLIKRQKRDLISS